LCISLLRRCHKQQPISLQAPVLPNVTNPMQRSPLWGPFQQQRRALPTNEFWTNLVLEEGAGNVALFPYTVAVASARNGLRVSYPRVIDGSTAAVDSISDDLIIGSAQQESSRYVSAFDELSVTLQVEFGQDAKVSFPLVRGSPFISARYTNAAPVLSTVHAILDVRGCDAGQMCETDTLRISMDDQNVRSAWRTCHVS
jgi:endoglucanase Acf2